MLTYVIIYIASVLLTAVIVSMHERKACDARATERAEIARRNGYWTGWNARDVQARHERHDCPAAVVDRVIAAIRRRQTTVIAAPSAQGEQDTLARMAGEHQFAVDEYRARCMARDGIEPETCVVTLGSGK